MASARKHRSSPSLTMANTALNVSPWSIPGGWRIVSSIRRVMAKACSLARRWLSMCYLHLVGERPCHQSLHFLTGDLVEFGHRLAAVLFGNHRSDGLHGP